MPGTLIGLDHPALHVLALVGGLRRRLVGGRHGRRGAPLRLAAARGKRGEADAEARVVEAIALFGAATVTLARVARRVVRHELDARDVLRAELLDAARVARRRGVRVRPVGAAHERARQIAPRVLARERILATAAPRLQDLRSRV